MNKYSLIIFCLCLAMGSEAQRHIIPFKNEYINYPDTIFSRLNYDDTWNKTVVLLQKLSFGAKLIDKSSGTLTTEAKNISLTSENKKAEIDTSAWAVIQRIYDVPTNKYYAAKTGDVIWNMRIVSFESSTLIIIDSLNVTSATTIHGYNYIAGFETKKDYNTAAKSTGKLESILKKEFQ